MTILGKHTVSELKELLDAKDYQIRQVDEKAKSIFSHLDQDWQNDWSMFLDRWKLARGKANSMITKTLLANSFVGPTVMPAEDEYQAVLHALTHTTGTVQKGDFQDLSNRVDAISKIDFSKTPQPNALDLDLAGFKNADSTKKAIDEAARQAAEGAKAAAGGAKDFLGSNTGLIVAGGAGIVLTAATIIALKMK